MPIFQLCHYSNRKKTLRKHAYSNILKILQPKKVNFQVNKKSDIFHISETLIVGTR